MEPRERLRGHDYRDLIGRYLVAAYEERGLEVYDEVTIGTSILGKPRRTDLLVLQPSSGRALALECKYQDSSGTVDEKIPYALQDLQAMRMPAAIVYAGSGFSEGVLHLLQSAHAAAYCLPGPELRPIARTFRAEAINSGTWQLDHVVAQTFGFWDVVLEGKLKRSR
jgi:hypothetical protein